jgi:hypothetical protein
LLHDLSHLFRWLSHCFSHCLVCSLSSFCLHSSVCQLNVLFHCAAAGCFLIVSSSSSQLLLLLLI